MKRLCVISFCATTCLFGLSPGCIAQSNPWNGSWKLDPSSLRLDGATFSVGTYANGFTVIRGGKVEPDVVCDGKEQKSTDGAILTCTKSADGYVIVTSKDGKPTRKTTISISDDGKTRTSKSQVFPVDRKPFTMTMISERESGGPGPGGEWKEVTFSSSQDNGILSIEVNGDTVEFKEADSPKAIACKLDGADTRLPSGGSVSMMLADPHRLKMTYKDQDGQLWRERTFTLSHDGTTITERDVRPGPSSSIMSVVLRKQ
jgi:hypothetical protein